MSVLVFHGILDADAYHSPCSDAYAGGLMKIVATIRGICFYLTTFAFASPLFVVMLAVYPFVLMFDKFRYDHEHVMFFYNVYSVSQHMCGVYAGDEQSMLSIHCGLN